MFLLIKLQKHYGQNYDKKPKRENFLWRLHPGSFLRARFSFQAPCLRVPFLKKREQQKMKKTSTFMLLHDFETGPALGGLLAHILHAALVAYFE